MLNLRDIALETKTAVVEYPGMEDFKVTIRYVSRAVSKKILEDSEVKEMKNGMVVGIKRDEAKFAKGFAAHCIVTWEGLTLEHVSRLMLIDLDGKDLSTEVPYSPDNAEMLLTSSNAFNSFIDSAVFELDTFR